MFTSPNISKCYFFGVLCATICKMKISHQVAVVTPVADDLNSQHEKCDLKMVTISIIKIREVRYIDLTILDYCSVIVFIFDYIKHYYNFEKDILCHKISFLTIFVFIICACFYYYLQHCMGRWWNWFIFLYNYCSTNHVVLSTQSYIIIISSFTI